MQIFDAGKTKRKESGKLHVQMALVYIYAREGMKFP